MRSAPTLKIWMTPLASVAMLEKLALLKIALCSAPVLSSATWRCTLMLGSRRAAAFRASGAISFFLDGLFLDMAGLGAKRAIDMKQGVRHPGKQDEHGDIS